MRLARGLSTRPLRVSCVRPARPPLTLALASVRRAWRARSRVRAPRAAQRAQRAASATPRAAATVRIAQRAALSTPWAAMRAATVSPACRARTRARAPQAARCDCLARLPRECRLRCACRVQKEHTPTAAARPGATRVWLGRSRPATAPRSVTTARPEHTLGWAGPCAARCVRLERSPRPRHQGRARRVTPTFLQTKRAARHAARVLSTAMARPTARCCRTVSARRARRARTAASACGARSAHTRPCPGPVRVWCVTPASTRSRSERRDVKHVLLAHTRHVRGAPHARAARPAGMPRTGARQRARPADAARTLRMWARHCRGGLLSRVQRW